MTTRSFDDPPRGGPCAARAFTRPINHRIACTVTGATVALSTLWAGFVVFGPVSDQRALRLAAGPSPAAELRRSDSTFVRLVTRAMARDTRACGKEATRVTGS